MNPRFIDIQGQRLAYFESSGAEITADAPSVLFLHGISLSSRAFLGQVDSPLADKFRLTALDLPGHGMSAPASDPDATYTLERLAAIISEFAERLGLNEAFFVGWSLGGNLLVEALDRLPSPRGIMLIGTFLPSDRLDMGQMAYPHPALASLFKEVLAEEETTTLAAALLKPGAVVPSFVTDDIRRTDPRFRAVLGKTIAAGLHKDEVSIAAGLEIPLAFTLGAEDQLCRDSYLRSLRMPTLWRGEIQLVPDAGHIPQWEQPGIFNRMLEEFIQDVSGMRSKTKKAP